MPPPEDTKEAFDWKQGAPSGTVLSAFAATQGRQSIASGTFWFPDWLQ